MVNVVREEIPSSLPDGVHGRRYRAGVGRGVTAGGHVTGSVGSLAWRGEGSARVTDGWSARPVGGPGFFAPRAAILMQTQKGTKVY